MASFFDDGHQQGLDFICGDKKLSTMQTGVLRMNGTEPIVFLCKPLTKRMPIRNSKPAPDGASRPSPSSSMTAGPASAGSTVEPPKDDIFSSPNIAKTIPPGNVHPINDIIDDLLQLFKAYYQVHMPRVVREKKAINVPQQVPIDSEDWRRQRWGKLAAQGPNRASVIVPPEVVTDAAQLEHHMAVGGILYNYIESEDWPDDDKQKDQTDPKHRRKLDTAKRPELDEGTFEAPVSKRRR
ncbi:hypothetical protein C8Q74DRAFT_917245 [Fomes fomentarius]|nr:hypothetical protein C8Q74DRAFT_917245 [Fomes fomentarius]